MVVITNQTVVACSPEELFDYCVDLRNELEWNPTAKSMEKLTDGPVGVGTKFLARWKGAPSAIEVECLEFDRPLRWVHRNGGPIAVTFTGGVEPVDGGSLLRVRFDARPRGWFRLVFPAFVVMARRQEKANMTYLREAVERRTGDGPRTGGAAAREMPLIHRILRRQFAEVRTLVQEVPAADATRVGSVADHLGFLLEELHMHHTTEDDLIWPKLLDRAGLDAPLVERMEEQHQQIDVSVAEVRAAISVWRSDPTQATSAGLADRIGELLVVLEGHLDEEEQVVVPLIDLHLTQAEWEEVGERGFEKFTPAQRWIATGQLVEVATPEEVAMMFATLPPPVKVLWHLLVSARRVAQELEVPTWKANEICWCLDRRFTRITASTGPEPRGARLDSLAIQAAPSMVNAPLHTARAPERLALPMIIRTRAHRSASKPPPPTRTTPSRTGWTGRLRVGSRAHSPRAGHATSAAVAGVALDRIDAGAAQTRETVAAPL